MPAARPRVVVLPDPDALAREAAELVLEALGRAIERRGRADAALTGGSSATGLFRALAAPESRGRLQWGRVHLWWGDDRYVPSTHPDSNAGLAYQHLLGIAARAGESGEGAGGTDLLAGKVSGLPIPAGNVHPIPVDAAIARGPDGARWAAAQYAEELRRALPVGPGGLPAFDLVLLGVGPDGHILSTFPGSRALAEGAPLVVAVRAPGHDAPHLERVTLNPRFLEAAGRIVVMIPGQAKAAIVRELFGSEDDPERLPAQLAMRENATWLLDEAAAAELPAEVPASRR
ncbi:MAG TPA: 6-phosphogluconolactonase [Candidatus Limnocylindrales bacterium]|nr:6-phosphogluconolactonase [Candidatus Limnocylindrales bacterium]